MFTSRETRVVVLSLLLMGVTLAFYSPISHNTFTEFDDASHILRNSHVQNGLSWPMARWAFTTFYAGYWHPVTWMSHALDCQLFGLNPAGHHYVNLLLHVTNAVLLFLLLLRVLGRTGPALLTGMLFALHPAGVESVAWAAERKNVLSTLFFLLAIHAYDRYGRTGKRGLYVVMAGLFVAGLMAKPQVVTLPFVLLLWDYWPLGRMRWSVAPRASPESERQRSLLELLAEKVPLFVLAAADSVITVLAQKSGDAVRTTAEISVAVRLENAVVSYIRYIGMMFWPTRLAPMYPHTHIPVWQVAASVIALLAVSTLVIYQRQRRYLAVGWFWFLGTMVPMIGLVSVGEQAMADRFAYIPYMGLFIALVVGLDEFGARGQISKAWLASAGALLVIALGCLTWRQLGYWRDDETLWRHTLAVTNENYMAQSNLGLALATEGRSDEALEHFRAAKALHKYPAAQLLTLAMYELRTGHPQEAIAECDGVLKSSSDAKLGATAWGERGEAALQLGHYDEAAGNFQNALRLNRDEGAALTGLGMLALREGKTGAAVEMLTQAARVAPSDVGAYLLSQALRRAGRQAEADAVAGEVARVSPDVHKVEGAAGRVLSLVGLKPL